MNWSPAPDRYQQMTYRRCGRSGLALPVVSLGLWQNFGGTRPFEESRHLLRRAFDLGVTHFDLANNYGPPYGSAEETFGAVMARDLRAHRDELVVSTKAGYDMWPGPYGDGGSRKYLMASLDQSLRRMGLHYVDIFYSHRPDPVTPIEETMGALATAVHQGKALYAAISNYPAELAARAATVLDELGAPLLVHQPSYSMFNRWVEPDLLELLRTRGVGAAVFSPLAQGLLSDRYLEGVPVGSRASREGSLPAASISEDKLARVRGLAALAQARGQSLSQMALSWVLRDPVVTTAIVGVSSAEQLEANLRAALNTEFSPEELARVDEYAAAPGQTLPR